jgi:hypothetical protein
MDRSTEIDAKRLLVLVPLLQELTLLSRQVPWEELFAEIDRALPSSGTSTRPR